jgi:hypothetical protein
MLSSMDVSMNMDSCSSCCGSATAVHSLQQRQLEVVDGLLQLSWMEAVNKQVSPPSMMNACTYIERPVAGGGYRAPLTRMVVCHRHDSDTVSVVGDQPPCVRL